MFITNVNNIINNRKTMKFVSTLLVLFSFALHITICNVYSLTAPLCAQPSNGCGSLVKPCVGYSGCILSNGVCVKNPKCNQLKCLLKDLALRTATKILPGCVTGNSNECRNETANVASHLQLAELCYADETILNPTIVLGNQSSFRKDVIGIQPSGFTYFVSAELGSDGNSGLNRNSPFLTIQFALDKILSHPQSTLKTIVLMKGIYRVLAPFTLSYKHSNLSILGENGAIISGAYKLTNLVWNSTLIPVKNNNNNGVIFAKLPNEILSNLGDFSVLYLSNTPSIRAR